MIVLIEKKPRRFVDVVGSVLVALVDATRFVHGWWYWGPQRLGFKEYSRFVFHRVFPRHFCDYCFIDMPRTHKRGMCEGCLKIQDPATRRALVQ